MDTSSGDRRRVVLDLNPGEDVVLRFFPTQKLIKLRILDVIWGTQHLVNLLAYGAAARSSETHPTHQTTGFIVCELPVVLA